MSRVLSLSLADKLYDRVSEHAENQGLTVYQYVRRAVEMRADEDDHMLKLMGEYDDEPVE